MAGPILALATTGRARRLASGALLAATALSSGTLAGAGTVTPGTPGALPAFRVQATAALAAGAPVTLGHAFARGDLPAGTWSKLIASTPGGQTAQVQLDQTNAWPDGSLRFAALSFLSPLALAAGQTVSFQLGAGANALGAAGLAPAQFAALCDFSLHVSGYDYGADTFTVHVNDVLATMPQASAGAGYGANPLGGWRYTRQGPVCTEFHAWRMLKRDGDGASHRWVKAAFHARAWPLPGGGHHFECLPSLRQDQPYAGGHPLGTAGPSAAQQTRTAGLAVLSNAGAALAWYGGPSDPRVVAADQTAFSMSGSTLANAQAAAWLWDQNDNVAFGGTPFAVSGPGVPSGLTQSTQVYFLDAAKQLRTNRADSMKYDGQGAAFGTAGSGAVAIAPVTATYPASGWFGALPDATVPWVGQGGAARPAYMVAHDATYLLRRTRCLPPYQLDLAVPNYADTQGTNSFSLNRPPVRADIEQYGDNPADLRIGYMHRHQINLALNPLDRGRELKVLQQGWGYAELNMWQLDPRTGLALNGSGQAIGPMPPNPGFIARTVTSSSQGSPAYAGWDWSQDYWNWAYNYIMDASHQPWYLTMPLLRTGHAAFQEMMEVAANATMNGAFDRNQQGGSWTNILVGAGQNASNIRSVGWCLRSLGTADRFSDDASPARPLTRFNLAQQASFAGSGAVQSDIAQYNTLGLPYYGHGNDGYSPFMDGHAHEGLCMEAWVGDYPGWAVLIAAYHGFADSVAGNLAYFLDDVYHLPLKDPSGTPYTSWAAIYGGPKQSANDTTYPGVAPKPAGFYGHDTYGGNSFLANAGLQIPGVPSNVTAGLAMASWLGGTDPNAAGALAGILARASAAPFGGYQWTGSTAGETDCFPMFAIAPYGQ